MRIEFDPLKSAVNEDERGLSFRAAADFDFENALYEVDDRYDYGELRIYALGRIGARLHVLVFIPIEDGIRVISLRRANRREVIRHEQETR